MTVAGAGDVLETLSLALARESHNLSRWGDILWQQLYNQLQWEGESVPRILESEARRRRASPASPWGHRLTKTRESSALGLTLSGHTGAVSDCAVAPDGSFVVSASDDCTLKIWDARTGREHATLEGHTEEVNACAVSPDGSFVLSGSSDGTLRFWDPISGQELRALQGPRTDPGTAKGGAPYVAVCAVSADASFVVAGGSTTLQVYDVATGEILVSWRCGPSAVRACAVTPDGSEVVAAGSDHVLRVWEARTGTERSTPATMKGLGYTFGEGLAVSPDASLFVSSGHGGELGVSLKVWDARTGRELTELGRGDPSVLQGASAQGCAITPDGALVVSGHTGQELTVWDVQTGAELGRLEGHRGGITACAVAPDGSFLVTASKDQTLKIWDPRQFREADASPPAVTCCALAPAGSSLVCCNVDGTVTLHDARSGEDFGRLGGHSSDVSPNDCAVTADGSLVATAAAPFIDWEGRGELKIWDVEGRRELATMKHRDIKACAISPDGSFVVSVGSDRTGDEPGVGTIRVWDLPSGKERTMVEGWGTCALSPDGSFIVATSDLATMTVWDTRRGKDRAILSEGADEIVEVSGIFPDASLVASHANGRVTIWDARSGRATASLEGQRGCAISPDASFFVTAGADGVLRVRDPLTGAGQATLGGHERSVPHAVTPDGALVVAVSPEVTDYQSLAGTEGWCVVSLWDVAGGGNVLTMPLPATFRSLSLHPSLPLAAGINWGATLCILEFVGIEYGPIVVTAAERGGAPVIRCPACSSDHVVPSDRLGSEMTCPTRDCGLSLRVNPFVLGAAAKRGWRARLARLAG